MALKTDTIQAEHVDFNYWARASCNTIVIQILFVGQVVIRKTNLRVMWAWLQLHRLKRKKLGHLTDSQTEFCNVLLDFFGFNAIGL